MSAAVRTLFLGAGIILFIVAAWRDDRGRSKRFIVGMIALGLAAVTFPLFWDALVEWQHW